MSTDTTIERSVGATVGFAFAALVSGAFALAIFSEHPVWASGLALVGLAFAVAALTARSAGCPSCRNAMPVPGGNGTAAHCGSCGEYAVVRNGKLERIDPQFVSSEAVFGVHLDQVLHRAAGPGVSSPEPTRCCVCSAPAAREETVTQTWDTPGIGIGKRVQVKLKFPHCGAHRNGATVRDQHLKFRSYRYWKEFCARNGIPVASAGNGL